jgi:hypothetical protein
MANEKKSIIEEALLEAEKIDAAFKSNAKEILAHTMSSEIEEMVKESLTGSKKGLKEDEEEEIDLELDSDDDNEEEMDLDTEEGEEEMDLDLDMDAEEGDDEDMDMDLDMEDMESEEDEDMEDMEDMDMDLDLGDETEDVGMMEPMDTVDLTDSSDADVISVFKKMGPEDEIEVVNDNGMVTLKDNKSGSEYRIELNTRTGEVGDVEMSSMEEGLSESNQVIYEIVVDEDYMDEDYMDEDYMDEDYTGGNDLADKFYSLMTDFFDKTYVEKELKEDIGNDYQRMYDYLSEVLYDYRNEDQDSLIFQEINDLLDELRAHNRGSKTNEDYMDMNSNERKMSMPMYMKRKKYNTNQELASMYGDKNKVTMGDVIAARKKGNEDEMSSYMRHSDEDYASRTKSTKGRYRVGNRTNPNAISRMGSSTYMGESKNPQISKLINENTNLSESVSTLRSENEELKANQEKMVDALKQFRNKLQEVAVFNSNLTYAVRLFTEQSTTKEEKQEILKRLDEAKSLKESQSIYKQLVKEFTNSKPTIKESVEEKLNKTASSGSVQISEQTVFVHPELQNMKKLWEYGYKK